MTAKSRAPQGEIPASRLTDLIQRLKTGNLDTRESAVFALARMGKEAVPGLVAALENEENSRYWLIVALREILEPSSVNALIKTLSDRDEYVRKISAETLGKLMGVAALPDLIKALNDEEDGVRSTAAEALGKLKDTKAVKPLADLLLNDRYGNVREMAARALGEIGDESAVESLISALKDSKENVRAGCAEALGKIKHPQALGPLWEKLQDADWGVRKNAIWALGEIPTPESIPHLVSGINDQDSGIKIALAQTLAKIQDEAAVPELTFLLSDEIETVRKAGSKALKHLAENQTPLALLGKALTLARTGNFIEADKLLDSALQFNPAITQTIPVPSFEQLAKIKPELKNWLQEKNLVARGYSINDDAWEETPEEIEQPPLPQSIKLAAELYNNLLSEQTSSLKFQQELLAGLTKLELDFRMEFWEEPGYQRLPYLKIKDRENNQSILPTEINLDFKEAGGQRFSRQFFQGYYNLPPEETSKAFLRQILIPVVITAQQVKQKGLLKYRTTKLEDETRQKIKGWLEIINRENPEDVQNALTGLRKFSETGFPLIIKALHNPEQNRRENLAEILGDLKDERAVPHLIEILKLEPESLSRAANEALLQIGELASPLALYGKVVALEQSGQSENAVSTLLSALKLDPDLTTTAKNESLLQGKQFKALWGNRKKSENKITDAEYWYNKGLALGEESKYQEEIDSYDKAISLNPAYFEAWYNKGLALGELGRYQEEIQCYETALTINPDSPQTWYNLGLALREQNSPELELECYNKAIAADPDYLEAWYNKAVALGELGRTQEEIDSYTQVLRLNPQDLDAWFNQGLALKQLGNDHKAEQCFDRLLELNPGDENAWFQKGQLAEARNDYPSALNAYAEALSLNYKSAESWNRLGFCQQQTGKITEALMSYDQALRIDPQREDVQERKTNLSQSLLIKNLILERALQRQNHRAANSLSLDELRKLNKYQEHLFKLLQNEDLRIRIETYLTLGELKLEGSTKYLLEALHSPEPRVREAAAHSLGLLKSENAFTPIKELLQDSDPQIRNTAVHSLVQINPRQSKTVILELLKDSDPGVKEKTAKLLGELNAQEAANSLLEALNDADPMVISAAVKALGRLKVREALKPLLQLLNTNEPELKRTVVGALRIIAPQAAFKIFVKLLNSPDEQIRAQSILALGESASEEAVQILLPHLTDSHWGVRLIVIQILIKLARVNPDSALALYGEAAALLQEGRSQEAIPVLKKTFELNPMLKAKAALDPLLSSLKIKTP